MAATLCLTLCHSGILCINWLQNSRNLYIILHTHYTLHTFTVWCLENKISFHRSSIENRNWKHWHRLPLIDIWNSLTFLGIDWMASIDNKMYLGGEKVDFFHFIHADIYWNRGKHLVKAQIKELHYVPSVTMDCDFINVSSTWSANTHCP